MQKLLIWILCKNSKFKNSRNSNLFLALKLKIQNTKKSYLKFDVKIQNNENHNSNARWNILTWGLRFQNQAKISLNLARKFKYTKYTFVEIHSVEWSNFGFRLSSQKTL